mmetsp:Transcript_34037/g.82534  ORF Transcript_34037/g.82534 Transcript_34037/m.82534 type:complete len:235 (+) Transcript_34037:845-1549(+)
MMSMLKTRSIILSLNRKSESLSSLSLSMSLLLTPPIKYCAKEEKVSWQHKNKPSLPPRRRVSDHSFPKRRLPTRKKRKNPKWKSLNFPIPVSTTTMLSARSTLMATVSQKKRTLLLTRPRRTRRRNPFFHPSRRSDLPNSRVWNPRAPMPIRLLPRMNLPMTIATTTTTATTRLWLPELRLLVLPRSVLLPWPLVAVMTRIQKTRTGCHHHLLLQMELPIIVLFQLVPCWEPLS